MKTHYTRMASCSLIFCVISRIPNHSYKSINWFLGIGLKINKYQQRPGIISRIRKGIHTLRGDLVFLDFDFLDAVPIWLDLEGVFLLYSLRGVEPKMAGIFLNTAILGAFDPKTG